MYCIYWENFRVDVNLPLFQIIAQKMTDGKFGKPARKLHTQDVFMLRNKGEVASLYF